MAFALLRPIVCLSLVLLVGTYVCSGQASNWSGGASKQTGKAKHKIKDLKKHLEEWGMDSSYNHTFLVGGKLNSDGWSGCVYLMKRKNYHISSFWQLEFSEIKHEKQVKQQGTNTAFPELGNATPYVFGKINNLYTLKFGYGNEELLLPAVMEGNISVAFRYGGGISLGILKPYELKLIYADYSTNPATAHLEEQPYNHADSAYFLNNNTILGAAPWSNGLNNITLVPGAYFEVAVAIMPGKRAFVQVITLGVNASLYSQNLPIMADVKAYPYDVCLFAGLAIGKRWN